MPNLSIVVFVGEKEKTKTDTSCGVCVRSQRIIEGNQRLMNMIIDLNAYRIYIHENGIVSMYRCYSAFICTTHSARE